MSDPTRFQLGGVWYEADVVYIDSAGNRFTISAPSMAERLRATESRSGENLALAFQWCRLHDQLLGFIQARPEVFKDFMKNDPREAMPNPESTKALARMVEKATALCEFPLKADFPTCESKVDCLQNGECLDERQTVAQRYEEMRALVNSSASGVSEVKGESK